MKTEKEAKISFWAHHLTTIVSVTLVLLLLGMIAMVWACARGETRRLKEQIEISVVMRDSVPAEVTRSIADKLAKTPYAMNLRTVSKEEALRNWTADTGEDLEALFGVNPLSEEVTFSVRADYASAASVAKIKKELEGIQGVEAVSVPDTRMIEDMNRNISRITLILGVIAAVMLVISFVLVNNTVHLAIYSKRFSIHTMKLVGATNGFIRRPIVMSNMSAGALAGLFASGILAAVLAASGESGLPEVASHIGWLDLAILAALLVVAGAALCAIASLISANSYLRKDYDQLFR